MVELKRNKKIFYICKKYIDPETNVTKYREPQKVLLNYQPTNSDSQVLALGTDYSKYLKVTGTSEELSIFSNKDKCYVYKSIPKNFDGMCYDADYEVNGDPMININEGELMLKKLSGEDERD
jgi:hypothetical protein